MICSQCQADVLNDATFCDQCGGRLDTACAHCGAANRREARFCKNCGHAINETQLTPPPLIASGARAPRTYLPQHLSEKILVARQTLDQERKRVTVLFADIRGSTAMIEGLDPEEAQRIIDPVLRIMMDAVHRFEGTVNQVLGDGIMALFGAPLAHEDHALRACYAALAMREGMHRYYSTLETSKAIKPFIGIGLNSGEVVVRSIDNDLNMDYSAIGETTNLASRMQDFAKDNSAVLTAATLREVEGFVDVKSLGGLVAKGIPRLIEAYELIRATSARNRLQAGVARGLTPFVGRSSEVEVFESLTAQASAGRGQVLAMVGEPGMGKSRLVYEFTRTHLPKGWSVFEGASVSYGKATPYFPLVELLRRYFSIGDNDLPEDVQDKVVMQVLEIDPLLIDVIPSVLALFSALPEETPPILSSQTRWMAQCPNVVISIDQYRQKDAQQRRRFTLDSLKRLLVRESQNRPLLLVFEDLHWIDNETQAFLDGLVDSLPMSRILLIANYRPGYSHQWGNKTFYTQLRVDRLRDASAEQLLENLLGNNRDLGSLKELLLIRTEGNPFFVEESVRAIIKTCGNRK